MFDHPSVLPPNRTPLEEALEQAVNKGKPDLTPVAQLMNPDTCPAHLLGWLAWAFSVDVWEPKWPEDRKRATIRNAIKIHRVKGTRGAVRRALGAIGFEVEISEWFENGEAPRTFRIDAVSDDILEAGFPVSTELLDMVSTLIDNVKPVAAHYSLRVGERMATNAYVRTGTRQQVRHECDHDPIPRVHVATSQTALRVGIRQRQSHQITHDILTRSAA